MKPESQRVAIAEACGWRFSPFANPEMKAEALHCWVPPNCSDWVMQLIPDYLADLNAMAEAKRLLNEDQRGAFINELRVILNNLHRDDPKWYGPTPFDYVNATAEQEATAFVRALNLWVEEAV